MKVNNKQHNVQNACDMEIQGFEINLPINLLKTLCGEWRTRSVTMKKVINILYKGGEDVLNSY